MTPDELTDLLSPIRIAYGIPKNVPIIEELDRRFERMEAELNNETERCRAAITDWIELHEVDQLTGPELDAAIRRALEPK